MVLSQSWAWQADLDDVIGGTFTPGNFTLDWIQAAGDGLVYVLYTDLDDFTRLVSLVDVSGPTPVELNYQGLVAWNYDPPWTNNAGTMAVWLPGTKECSVITNNGSVVAVNDITLDITAEYPGWPADPSPQDVCVSADGTLLWCGIVWWNPDSGVSGEWWIYVWALSASDGSLVYRQGRPLPANTQSYASAAMPFMVGMPIAFDQNEPLALLQTENTTTDGDGFIEYSDKWSLSGSLDAPGRVPYTGLLTRSAWTALPDQQGFAYCLVDSTDITTRSATGDEPFAWSWDAAAVSFAHGWATGVGVVDSWAGQFAAAPHGLTASGDYSAYWIDPAAGEHATGSGPMPANATGIVRPAAAGIGCTVISNDVTGRPIDVWHALAPPTWLRQRQSPRGNPTRVGLTDQLRQRQRFI